MISLGTHTREGGRIRAVETSVPQTDAWTGEIEAGRMLLLVRAYADGTLTGEVKDLAADRYLGEVPLTRETLPGRPVTRWCSECETRMPVDSTHIVTDKPLAWDVHTLACGHQHGDEARVVGA